jgi:predicted metalloprotease with PDZ domain
MRRRISNGRVDRPHQGLGDQAPVARLVLGARSGLRTPELYRENLGLFAAGMDRQAGRAWRPLADTATAAQLLCFGRPEWSDWRRGVDLYPESALVWLEADVLIRQKTAGKKSLDDFVLVRDGSKPDLVSSIGKPLTP